MRTKPSVDELRDAIQADDARQVRRLLDGVKRPWPKLVSRFGTKETLLACAAAANAVGVVAFLLDAGVEVDEIGECRQTALEIAAGSGYQDVAQKLLQAGAHPTRLGRRIGIPSALHRAAFRGDVELVAMLLRFGASPDAVCRDPDVTLYRIYGDVLRLLVAAGGTLPDDVNELLIKRVANGDWEDKGNGVRGPRE